VKKSQIEIGKTYFAKVSGVIVPVRITGIRPLVGWDGLNPRTNHYVQIRTAARLRQEVAE
jgi:hypothetical protein